jgi:hypothetical protein
MAIKFKSDELRLLCQLVFESTVKDLISAREFYAVTAPEGYQPCGEDITFRFSANGPDNSVTVRVLIRAKAREDATAQIVLLPTEMLEEFHVQEILDVNSGLPSPTTPAVS